MRTTGPGMVRRHFSPAMVVALLALFVALGGSGYAALKVNGRNITNHSITGKKLKRNTVTGREVRNGSLQRGDFEPGQLNTGFSRVVMRVGSPTFVESAGFSRAEAYCRGGEMATGGGLYNEDQVYTMAVTSTYPLPNPTTAPATGDDIPASGWRVWVANNSTTDNQVQAYVLCASG